MRPDVQDTMRGNHARRGHGRHADAGERRVPTDVEAVEWCGMAHELSCCCREERSIRPRVAPVEPAMRQRRRRERNFDAVAHVGHVALDGPPQNLDGLIFRLSVGRRLVAALGEKLLPVLERLGRLRFVEW